MTTNPAAPFEWKAPSFDSLVSPPLVLDDRTWGTEDWVDGAFDDGEQFCAMWLCHGGGLEYFDIADAEKIRIHLESAWCGRGGVMISIADHEHETAFVGQDKIVRALHSGLYMALKEMAEVRSRHTCWMWVEVLESKAGARVPVDERQRGALKNLLRATYQSHHTGRRMETIANLEALATVLGFDWREITRETTRETTEGDA